MSLAGLLVIALVLDAILGEPKWLWSRLPHPAVLMGRAVGWIDVTFNKGSARKTAGTLSFAALCIGALMLGVMLTALPGQILDIVIAAILLAQRSLADHVRAVGDALRLSVADARIAVAQIVGRDTAQMDGPAIARAAIESSAENQSDGVIAPAFWFLIGGLPGLLLYKITNTADSMIGYKTERHREFGWAAARFDDVLNWVPARLTAVLIWLCAPVSGWSDIAADARLHRSPNAGWPEAAMARVLHVALSGPRAYDGQMQDFPFVNPKGRHKISADEIYASVRVLWKSWAIGLGVVLLLAVF